MSKLKVLDLFSGIGGFSLGLERTDGFETVAFCEIEEFPRRVLAKHWPEVPQYEDVRTLTGDVLKRDGISVDVIIGGFPCQDISLAGKGAGIRGEESGLFWQLLRLCRDIRPRIIFLENVTALLNRGMGDVLAGLASVGYDAEWDCLPAAFVGAPHNRDRIWIVAYPQRDKQSWPESCFGALGRVGREQQHFPWDRSWKDALSELRGLDDGLPRSVASTDGYRNAVVPQIPEMIGHAILQAEAAA